MSRIGKNPISLPSGVTVAQAEKSTVTIKGPKGTLSQYVDPAIKLSVADSVVTLTRASDQKSHKAKHGLYRSLVQNAVVGVSEGYRKTLELVGVGYKAANQGNLLELNLGYSHTIHFAIPEEVKVTTEMAKGKNPLVHLESIDKQLLGHVAAKIRSLRKVEPYKGKGIRFLGEQIRRKAGKTAAK